jgi:hypothetical protein
VSQRLTDGVSRCDLSQEHLHVNGGSWESRTASRSQIKAVLKVDRGVGWAPRGPAVWALLILPLWMVPWVWASLQLLLQRSGLEKNKAIVFILRQGLQCQGLASSAQFRVWIQ